MEWPTAMGGRDWDGAPGPWLPPIVDLPEPDPRPFGLDDRPRPPRGGGGTDEEDRWRRQLGWREFLAEVLRGIWRLRPGDDERPGLGGQIGGWKWELGGSVGEDSWEFELKFKRKF